MLGTGPSGPMQLRGRISVVPGGQDSPGWICVPRAPPGPRFDGCDCWAMSGVPTNSAAASEMTDLSRMSGSERCGSAICRAEIDAGTPLLRDPQLSNGHTAG